MSNPIIKIKFVNLQQIIDLDSILTVSLSNNSMIVAFRDHDHTVELTANPKNKEQVEELETVFDDLYTKWKQWRFFEQEQRCSHVIMEG